MYKTPINTLEELRERMVASSETIRNTREIFEEVRNSMQRRPKHTYRATSNNFYNTKFIIIMDVNRL